MAVDWIGRRAGTDFAMNRVDELRRLFGRIKNDLRAISHTQRTRVQVKLLDDVKATLSLLEAEVLKSELATEEN